MTDEQFDKALNKLKRVVELEQAVRETSLENERLRVSLANEQQRLHHQDTNCAVLNERLAIATEALKKISNSPMWDESGKRDCDRHTYAMTTIDVAQVALKKIEVGK